MVNLLKEGLAPGKKVLQNTCHSCSTVYEFTPDEGQEVQGWGMHELITLPCPHKDCGKPQYIHIPKEKVSVTR